MSNKSSLDARRDELAKEYCGNYDINSEVGADIFYTFCDGFNAARTELAKADVIKSIDYDAHNNLLRKLAEANARIVEFEGIKKGHLKVQDDMQKRIDELKEYKRKYEELCK